jgi:hypothetical protein
MTKIKNTVAYKIKSPLSLTDYAVGTNNENGVPGFAKGQTISIGLNEMRELFLQGLSPETGGTLKITEIVPDTEETSISDVANAISPAYAVQRYEILAIDLNGVIYILKQQNITFGIGQDELADSDFIKLTSIVNKGTGQDLISYNPTLKQYEVLTIDSETLTKTVDADGLHLEIPSTSSIPALYVNDLYIPTEEEFLAGNTKGNGSLAKPFTNTITSYVAGVPTITPNTAIQNAKTAFIGTGTALAPQLSGQKIIIQNNNSSYTFSGDFSVSNLNIEIEGNVISTISGYLVDMDDNTKFDATTSFCTITIKEGATLEVRGDGFRNSGNTEAGITYATGRTMYLLGNGSIYSSTNSTSKYIINSDTSNSGNNNDGGLTFQVKCQIKTDLQGVYNIGGTSRVDFYNFIGSGTLSNTVNTSLKAFNQTGGGVRFFENAVISLQGGTRTNGITFTPTGGFTPSFEVINLRIQGICTNLFNKTNTSDATLNVQNCNSGYGLIVTNIFESSNLWSVRFTNNVLASGTINSAKADLTKSNTVSSINTIGNNIVETLVVYGSRVLAVAGGLTKGCKFVNRKTITAGNFVIGTEYQILTTGTTDFTLIGASANTVGINFTATGVGTGTGTAYQHTIDILI